MGSVIRFKKRLRTALALAVVACAAGAAGSAQAAAAAAARGTLELRQVRGDAAREVLYGVYHGLDGTTDVQLELTTSRDGAEQRLVLWGQDGPECRVTLLGRDAQGVSAFDVAVGGAHATVLTDGVARGARDVLRSAGEGWTRRHPASHAAVAELAALLGGNPWERLSRIVCADEAWCGERVQGCLAALLTLTARVLQVVVNCAEVEVTMNAAACVASSLSVVSAAEEVRRECFGIGGPGGSDPCAYCQEHPDQWCDCWWPPGP